MQNPWFEIRRPRNECPLRLFCFPFAGGNCSTYSEWPEALGDLAEVICVQLPGRGIRFNERPYTRMEPLIDALVPAFRGLGGNPFAFFGHSMGALIAYEVSCRLRTIGVRQPVLFFASGTEPPHLVQQGEGLYRWNDVDLIARLRRLNGMPDEILENRELVDLLLPVIRADFELTETYKASECPGFDFALGAFGGSDDPEVSPQIITRWSEVTSGKFQFTTIPGDHFFLKSRRSELLDEIRKMIGACVNA